VSAVKNPDGTNIIIHTQMNQCATLIYSTYEVGGWTILVKVVYSISVLSLNRVLYSLKTDAVKPMPGNIMLLDA
jgi:hypothetical protein